MDDTTICTMKVGLFGRLSLRGGMGGIIVSHPNEVYRGRQLVSVRYYVYTMFTVNTGHHEAWSPVTQTPAPPCSPAYDWSAPASARP